ncbi:MAG: hypothetical protein Fur0012_09140 [Elusimicrobiota bacterium]
MFKKEENKFSKPLAIGLSAVLISAALFIAGKSLFSDSASITVSGNQEKHSFFEKEGESKFIGYGSASSAQRSDSISLLVKANEGYASSMASNSPDKIKENLSSSANMPSETSLSDFEKQARAELGEPDKPEQNQPQTNAGAPTREENSGNAAAMTASSTKTSKQGSAKSSLSGKKSAFTSRLSAMNNFNKTSRLGRNFGSGEENQDSSTGYSSNGSASGSGGQGSSAGSLSSSMGGSSSGESSSGMGGASSSAGRTDSSNKPKPDVPRPQMLVYKQTYDFGSVNLYEHAKRLVTVMNVGKKDLRVGKINRLNEEINFFSVQDNKCSNRTLKPGEECTFKINYTPSYYTSEKPADGFEIESNDADKIPYSNYIEVTGSIASYFYSSYWLRVYAATTKMDFGTVTAGHYLELNYLLKNNTSSEWYGLNFVRDANASFSVSYSNCPRDVMDPGSYCVIKVKFSPVDSLLKNLSQNYGKYYTVNGYNGQKQIMDKPSFPPNIIDRPFELELGGYIRVKARISGVNMITVRSIPLRAFTSARYPDPKMKRVDSYYSF